MNIIRTKAVELTVIPGIAYKQKLASGGAGIKIFRIDSDKTAVCGVDKRTGEGIIEARVDGNLFPAEAFDEALELTNGLPYSARGKIKIVVQEVIEDNEVAESETDEAVDMVESDEYKAIVDRYSDEKGKINYQLMNKDFIQFAAKSKVVTEMVAGKNNIDDIILFIVKSRATFLANKKESLDDKLVVKLIATLDEIDPRSAFKELKAHIKRMQSR